MSLSLRVRDVLSAERTLGWNWTAENLVEDLEAYIQANKTSEERHIRFLVEAYSKHKVMLKGALQEYQYE